MPNIAEKDEFGAVIPEQNDVRDSSDVELESQVPDGGYGWVVIAAIFVTQSCTWGINATFGIFLAYYLEHGNYPNATSLDYALIGGLMFGVCMICTAPVNYLTGRFGPRLPMYMGALLQSGGFMAASFSKLHIYELYLSYLCVGVGLGFTWLPTVNIISQWFEKRRSIANGITGAGSGVGGIVFSFASRAALSSLGLAWSLRMLAIASGVANIIAATLIRSRNKQIRPNYHPLNLKLLARLDICLLLGWTFVNQLGYVVVYYSLPSFATSLGLTSSQGAVLNALLNVGLTIGRPVLGLLSDRYGRIPVAGFGTLVNGIMVLAIWVPARSYGVMIFFALAIGGTVGMFWSTIGPLCTEVSGLKLLPEVLSLCWAAALLPLTFSEVIALKLRHGSGPMEYLYPQLFAGLSFFAASFFLPALWLHQRRRKQAD